MNYSSILFSPIRARSSALDLESNASWEPQIKRKSSNDKKSKIFKYFITILMCTVISMIFIGVFHFMHIENSQAGNKQEKQYNKGLKERRPKSNNINKISEDELLRAVINDRKARAPKIIKNAPKIPNKNINTNEINPGNLLGTSKQNSGMNIDSKGIDSDPNPDPSAMILPHNVSFPSAIKSSCIHNYGPSLHDCDYWVRTQGNSCPELEKENGFDCKGCICDSTALITSKGCLDYGPELHSCDFWLQLNVGQTCKDLTEKHGYDCSGCRCN